MASTFVHTPRYTAPGRLPGFRGSQDEWRLTQLQYHLVWVVRRRRSALTDQVAIRLDELLRQVAQEMDLDITWSGIYPDHVHLRVAATAELSPAQIVYRLKSETARALRKEFPHLLKIPSMWMGSYLVSSANELAQDDIDQYVRAHSTRA